MLPVKSKYKIAKRLGATIFEKTQSQKFALSEARSQKVRRGRRAPSDFGRQLLEKQRVRYTYSIGEKQLSAYAAKAYTTTNPSEELHRALEERLDSTAYRSGLALTRRAARQMISHGHITVNGRRVTIPSYRVKKGDVLEVREGSRSSALFAHLSSPDHISRAIPQWITVDPSLMRVEVKGPVTYTPTEAGLDYPAVFEFYSR